MPNQQQQQYQQQQQQEIQMKQKPSTFAEVSWQFHFVSNRRERADLFPSFYTDGHRYHQG